MRNRPPPTIPLDIPPARRFNPRVKPFLTLTFVLLVLVAVIGGGGLIFFLSYTTELSRKDKPAASATITPVRPRPAPSR